MQTLKIIFNRMSMQIKFKHKFYIIQTTLITETNTKKLFFHKNNYFEYLNLLILNGTGDISSDQFVQLILLKNINNLLCQKYVFHKF